MTGASGFVGANLVRALVASGHSVHALIHRNEAQWRLRGLDRDIRKHYASVLDPGALRAVLDEVKPDWIFHLAAYGAYSSQESADTIFETNVIGTKNVLDAAIRRGFAAFVNTGSSSEYGLADHAPSETELPHPNSAYAFSKAAATMYCTYRAAEENAKVATLRLYSVYGPLEEPTRFIPRLIAKGLDGGYPPLVDPAIARDFVYTDDVTRAYEMVAATPHEPGRVYNVGTGVQTAIADAVRVARDLFALAGEPAWGSMRNRSWDTSTWVANRDAIGREVGWAPRTDVRSGLAKMAEWIRDEPGMRGFYSVEHALPH